jgi:hypothetical protein
MNNLKKLLTILFTVLMILCLAACSGEDDTENNDDPTEPTLNMGTPDCVHIWGNWEEIVESSCTKKGTEQRSCTLCGKQEQQRTPATGHYYTEGVCSACGRNERACEHQNTERVIIKAPTCTEFGQCNILCTACDAVIDVDRVDPAGHGELTRIVEVETTCVDDGKVKMVCSVCGEVEHSYIIYAEGHNDTEWITIKEPTCTKPGHRQRVCHTCNKIIDEYFPDGTGHLETEWITVKEPTCEASGHQQMVCKTCDQVVDEYFPGSTGHRDYQWVTVKEPTCTESGYKQQICNICEEVIGESYPNKKGHSYQYVNAKAPTCTEAGWYDYSYCSICDYNQLEEKSRPATGHNNTAGLCGTCGATDPKFVKNEIADTPKLEHSVAKPADNVLNAPSAQVIQQTLEITIAEEKSVYSLTATHSGVYYIWVSQMYSGNTLKLYIKDDLGQTIFHDTNLANDEGLSAIFEAGKTYTLEIVTRTCVKPGDFVLNIGCQTATADISANSAVVDTIVFAGQTNVYTFTPAVDGVYYFWFSNLFSGFSVDIRVYNALGEGINSATNCTNGSGVLLQNLAAGQTYTVKVICRNGRGEYTLQLGKQQAMVDISKYNLIHDNLYYKEQVNRYSFTVPADGNYRIQLANIPNNLDVIFYVYNALGEQLYSDSYAYNDDGYSMSNLVAGATYTIIVAYRNSSVPYTLCVYPTKPVVALTDNTGAADSLEYKTQSNLYTFVAKEGGSYRVAITGLDANVSISVYIYDSNGTQIKSDTSMYNGNYLTLTDLVPGATYTIRVYANGVLTDYIISVQ